MRVNVFGKVLTLPATSVTCTVKVIRPQVRQVHRVEREVARGVRGGLGPGLDQRHRGVRDGLADRGARSASRSGFRRRAGPRRRCRGRTTVIAGTVLSTVTVNGVEKGLTRPDTDAAVAVNRYWPSGSVPGTAKSSGAAAALCWPICVPFMYSVTSVPAGAVSSTVSVAVLRDRVARAGQVAGDQVHIRRRQRPRAVQRERQRRTARTGGPGCPSPRALRCAVRPRGPSRR